MAYIGSWKIDDLLTFACNTHDAATGAATDADSVPSYRVYEDETGTAILNGSMAKLDDGNTTGFYSEQITLSAANGFEKGKCYTIYISATVDSVTGTTERHFQIGAEVDVRHAAGTAWASGAITAAVIATGAIDAATFAADVDAEILSYLVDDATRIDASALNTLSGHDPGETIMGATDTVVLTDGSLTAAKIAGDAITAAKLAADVTTELQSGLATTTHVQEVEDKIDTLDTNVDTLLARITSTLFAGITSLAEWLGLMAGKQTGNTTARNEIRATGAGSGTYAETTDSLEAVRDRGDAAWTTATGFSTHSASDVWAVGTRLLTAGTNIVLAKGTGVTGFNDLSAAQVNAEVDTALADYDGPTKAELDAAVAPLALEASVQTVDGNVDAILVDTAEIGAAGAGLTALASAANLQTVDDNVDAILADTGTDGVVVAAASKTGYRLSSTGVDDILDEQIGDSTITLRQALKLSVATLAGKLSGAATTTVTIRNAADDTDVVVATVDSSGNRSAVTLSL